MEKDYGEALAEPMHAGIMQAWVMGITFGMFQVWELWYEWCDVLDVGGCLVRVRKAHFTIGLDK